MAPKDPQDAPSGGVQKHRACDECRSRKLACSKEPTGCSRCRREGIACHYSAQKPMGRPRKRRLVEEAPSAAEEGPAIENVVVPSPAGPSAESHSYNVPSMTFPEDSTLSFLDDAAASNLDFMDLLPYNYLDNAQIDPQILVQNDGATNEATFPFSITGVDLLSGINFDEEPGSSAANMSKDISDSVHSYWQTRTLEATEHPESMSSDLSNSANSPESQPGQTPSPSSSSADPAAAPGLRAVPSVSCGCLSSLYLALDSLTRLPADVLGAIRVARQATKVAHDVIRCPVCSDPLTDDPCKPPPIQCFQNLMCLAALVPSTCNAYAAILEMVDNEAAAAKREARGIWFSFKDIGGAWGVVGPNHYVDDCPKMAAFNNRNMAPDIWRTTMRAILRIDVYGIEPADDVAADGIRQRGLRDVVKLLEERSAKRHDQMDELFAAGKAPERPEYLLQQSYKPVPPEQRNCMIVLEAARIALDNLVIA